MAMYVCQGGKLVQVNHIYQCVTDRMREGIEYQRYDWLKAVAGANTTMLKLPTDSYNVDFSFRNYTIYNTLLFNAGDNYSYHMDDNYGNFYIWKTNELERYYNVWKKGQSTSVNAYDGNINIGETNVKSYGKINNVLIRNAEGSNFNINIDFSAIYVDGVLRYSPCQLLRPISAQLSTDNKPHPSGECGMVDSVSGKFFGNANTSGSFSVYND